MVDKSHRDDAPKAGDPDIAAAEWLFQDEAAKQAGAAPTTAPSSAAETPPRGGDSGETFALVGDSSHEMPVLATPVPETPASGRPRETIPTRPRPAAPESYPIDPEAVVDVVWSRGAEWGPNLMVLALWLLAIAVVLYFLLGWETYGLAFFVLLAGAAGAIILAYPILITLERPVRITPEQAVKDYYGALSHHVPHYRRMWLLLARTGRLSSSYGSFEGFKSYWKDKLRTLRGGRIGSMTPLVFEIENYRSDKSAGKAQVDARFTLKVSVRGQRQAGPIASVPGEVSLVRGPDKMWYLETGTFPHARRESRGE